MKNNAKLVDFKSQAILRIDALYYHFAIDLSDAVQKSYQSFQRKSTIISDAIVDEMLFEYDPNTEEQIPSQELFEIELKLADEYGKTVQQIAIIHLLCAASLEAHINIRSQEFLSGQILEQFERFSLESKWLFFPTILGKKGFVPGAQPYQSFATLAKYRNSLAHFKGKPQKWDSLVDFPALQKNGLMVEDALASLKCFSNIIGDLAKQLGEKPPTWLDRQHMNYFEIVTKQS